MLNSLLSLSKVIDLIMPQNQAYVHLCTKEQMMSVHENVARLQEVLEDLSGRSDSSINNVLESRIRDVAYQMEDIIEDDNPSSLCEKLTSLLCMRLLPLPRITTPSVFDSCAAKIGILLDEAMAVKGNTLQDKDASGARHPLTATSSSIHLQAPSSKLDLKEVPLEMMDRIFRGRRDLEILPITGMGGIGKTTLARAVYQHPRTLPHFDICSWVTVSQQFNVKEILRGLLPTDEQQNTPDGRLIEFVYKRLKGRRYLIVLDDMWDEKAWDGVRNAFPDDNKGSRIILTTRLSGVATRVGSSDRAHQMQFLNDEKSWHLLQDVVGRHEHWSREFEDLGRTISKNCRGLPLAVVSMAGLLKFNMTEEYWKRVARDTKSEMTANYDDELLGILALSYNNLPPYLKPCFLYFRVFPEDSEIRTEELVRLWAAEGFLKPRGSKKVEEVGEEYLEELVATSLVIVKKKKKHDGRITQEKHTNFCTDMFDLRRVSLGYIDHSDTGKLCSNTHVRCDSGDFDEVSVNIPNLRLMRVLRGNVTIANNRELSLLLYQLTNLRYLQLHFSSIENNNLPPTVGKSISKLQNLETLIFSGRWHRMGGFDKYVLVLPSEIWEMSRLRHLILVRGSNLPPCPATLSQISCAGLQTLTKVTNFDLTRSTAPKLSNLRKLKLHYNPFLPNGGRTRDFRLDNLVHLHQLEDLTVASKVNSDLSFPQKLMKLCLEDTKMPLEKMSLIGSLPNLEVLKLKSHDFEGNVWEPSEGEFLQLKYLKMEKLWSLKEWRAETEHFPQLETLIINKCKCLKEVPAGIGEINTLQKLVLEDCKLAEESVKDIKAEQESLSNDLLQVIISRESVMQSFSWRLIFGDDVDLLESLIRDVAYRLEDIIKDVTHSPLV